MGKEELMERYNRLRRHLEKLHRECEYVELEIREVERTLTLADVQFPTMGQQDEALFNYPLSNRSAS